MNKYVIVGIIGLALFIMSFFTDSKKYRVIAAMVVALGFLGPYIVEYADNEPYENVAKVPKPNKKTKNPATEEPTTEKSTTEKSTAEELEAIKDSSEEAINFIGENHTPTGAAVNVSIETWEKGEDYAIDGSTYNGGEKYSLSYMFSALEGNDSNISERIVSKIHYGLNKKVIKNLPRKDQYFEGKFVIGVESKGSPSKAKISILVDGKERYNSGWVNGYSLNIKPFRVDCKNKSELIIKIDCKAKGNPLVIGMVNNE